MVSTETERAVSTIGVLDLVAPKDVSSPRTIWLSSCTASSALCVSVPASTAITAELTDMTATARSHGLSVVFILPPCFKCDALSLQEYRQSITILIYICDCFVFNSPEWQAKKRAATAAHTLSGVYRGLRGIAPFRAGAGLAPGLNPGRRALFSMAVSSAGTNALGPLPIRSLRPIAFSSSRSNGQFLAS